MIGIDSNKCVKCNLCVKVCTKKIINPGPEVAGEKNWFCIKCGHCFAVCPSGAVTVMESREFEKTDFPQTRISPDQVMDLVKRRRSVRRYKPEPVSREHLDLIIEAASNAPSAKNIRHLRAYVYTDGDLIRQIARRTPEHYKKLLKIFNIPGFSFIWQKMGYPAGSLDAYKKDFERLAFPQDSSDPVLHDAPTLIAFAAPRKDDMSIADGWIAAQTAILFAESIGVGTCYNGYLSIAANKDKTLKSLMKIPANEHVVSTLTLGYPDIQFKRYVPRKKMRTNYI